MNISSEVKGAPKQQFTTKDLHPGDRQRVAHLINEFSRVEGEQENVLSLLTLQRTRYEDQLRQLAAERQKMNLEHEEFRSQLKENQRMTDKYQKIVKEQREKRDTEKLADQLQMKGIEERRNLIWSNLLNFCALDSPKDSQTKVKSSALDKLSTDFECDQLTGDQGGKLCGTIDLDNMVSSTHSSLTDFSNLNLMMHSEDSQKIITTKLSGRPNLSGTRIGKYDNEAFTPGSHESKNALRTVFSNDGTSILSSDIENASVQDNKMISTSGHVTDDFVSALKIGESSVQHSRRFQNTEVERGNTLLPDQKNQHTTSLYNEQRCFEEVLRSQNSFLKNREQGHWLPYDTEHPSAKGKSSVSSEHLADQAESKSSKFPLEIRHESGAELQRPGHETNRTAAHSDNSSASLASFSSFKSSCSNPVPRLDRNESDSSLEESKIIDDLFFLS